MNNSIARFAKLSEQDQVNAVERGKKPLCEVSHRIESDLPFISMTTYGKLNDVPFPCHSRIYYAKGQEMNARRLRDVQEKESLTDEDHRELGRLYGYDDQEIESWIAERGEP